jgi:hypothetical protein
MTKRVGTDRGGDSRLAAGPAGPSRPEHWSVRAGTQGVARLDIPPDALRERTFELFCSFVVGARSGQAQAWHEMRVMVDGALAWSRRVATPPDGPDSLELRLRHVVPAGRPLRLSAVTEVHGSQRISLTLTADEE